MKKLLSLLIFILGILVGMTTTNLIISHNQAKLEAEADQLTSEVISEYKKLLPPGCQIHLAKKGSFRILYDNCPEERRL